jgi:hypothetical protein
MHCSAALLSFMYAVGASEVAAAFAAQQYSKSMPELTRLGCCTLLCVRSLVNGVVLLFCYGDPRTAVGYSLGVC